MNPVFLKRFLLLVLTFSAFLMVTAMAMVTGRLQPRAFGFVALALVLFFFLAFFIVFRKAAIASGTKNQELAYPLDPAITTKLQGHIRACQRIVIFLGIILVIGLWETRGEPLFPRITGATINLLITATFFRAMRRWQARLRGPGGQSE